MVLLRHKGGNKRPQRRKSREREETGLLQEKKKRGFNILVISEKNIPLERNGRTAKNDRNY